jgi:hypothetical protein
MKKRRPARKATTTTARQNESQRGSHGGRSRAGRTNYYQSAARANLKRIRQVLEEAFKNENVRVGLYQGPWHPPPADLLDYISNGVSPDHLDAVHMDLRDALLHSFPPDHSDCRSAVEPEPPFDARTAVIDIEALPDRRPLLEAPDDDG